MPVNIWVQAFGFSIDNLKQIAGINGFLIGGASQNSKKFIDIIKKTII